MAAKLTKEEFCSKSRYMYQVADFLGVDRRTLQQWLEDSEELEDLKNVRYLPPKSVKRILDYFFI